jgi:hypothetical protein
LLNHDVRRRPHAGIRFLMLVENFR